MNLRIGNIRNYNNKILISSPSFKIGTNLKINLDGDVKSNKGQKPITDSNKEHKSNIELKQDVKLITDYTKVNKITDEEEKVALVLGITSIFTIWWMFK